MKKLNRILIVVIIGLLALSISIFSKQKTVNNQLEEANNNLNSLIVVIHENDANINDLSKQKEDLNNNTDELLRKEYDNWLRQNQKLLDLLQ